VNPAAARPEVTGRKTTAPNLLLIGYADDDTLEREELASEWRCTIRTIRSFQNEADGLPYFLHAGKIRHRVGSARQWMRRREQHPNVTRKSKR
jgi:hypothetical protein